MQENMALHGPQKRHLLIAMGHLRPEGRASVVGPQLGMCMLGGKFSTSLHTRASADDSEVGGSVHLGVTNFR